MDPSALHPAEPYAVDMGAVERRARAAMVALALSAAVRLYEVAVGLWQNSLLAALRRGERLPQEILEFNERLASAGSTAQLVALVVTAVLFLRWVHALTRLTRALGGETLRWSPGDAVWAFIIPFISFVRPYQVMRDVRDHLAPDAVPEPAVQVRADGGAHYRDVVMQAPPAPPALPHASLGAWWSCFWIGNLLAKSAARQSHTTFEGLIASATLNIAADVVEVVAAALAIAVVRGLTARLVERFRRIRHNPLAVLVSAGVQVAPKPS